MRREPPAQAGGPPPHILSFSRGRQLLLMKRHMGRLDFESTTLGLGGQAGLQWPLPGEDPAGVILKAHALGVNFFDTSNVYGPSQSTYGRAFRKLGLVPGLPGYREPLRRVGLPVEQDHVEVRQGRMAEERSAEPDRRAAGSRPSSTCGGPCRRSSVTGRGGIPGGPIWTLFLVHAVGSAADVDAAYVGYDTPIPGPSTSVSSPPSATSGTGPTPRGATPGRRGSCATSGSRVTPHPR